MRLITLLAFAIVALSCAAAGEAPDQTICPVTGKKLSTASSPVEVRVNGFRFLVLDEASREQALAEPAKAFAALAKNREAAEPISSICPIMGNRINPELYVQKDGYRVFICCAGCLKPVQGNWAKSLKKVAELAEQGDPENAPSM
jgi:hypothetical protein